MKTYNDRLNTIREMLATTFNCEADRKRCIEQLGHCYDTKKQSLIEVAKTIGLTFWEVPNSLHNTQGKTFKKNFASAPQNSEVMISLRMLQNLRDQAKNAPIIKKAPKVDILAPYVAKIEKTFLEQKQRVDTLIDMSKDFGMRVDASPHYVTNGISGVTALRVFWYLNGEFVSLSTIVAIAEKIEADKKAATVQ